jgi:hypothetical protein
VPVVAFAQKAKTIDELAKMYDVSVCKQCHVNEYTEWEKSYHATSLVGSPRTMATLGSFLRDGLMKEWTKSGVKEVKDIKVEHMMSCFKCHLPQIKDATDAVAQEIAQAVLDATGPDEAKRGPARKQLEKLGINCITCHNTKALIHEWVDGKPEPNVIYGYKGEGEHPGGAVTQFKNRKKSPIMRESILCGQCHGLGPNFDLPNPTQCATLYGSYLHAYIPSGGNKTCQECHMDKGHFMPGYRDADQAKKAVKVDVDTKTYYFLPRAGYSVPTAYVTVKMVNQAGHRIPDG